MCSMPFFSRTEATAVTLAPAIMHFTISVPRSTPPVTAKSALMMLDNTAAQRNLSRSSVALLKSRLDTTLRVSRSISGW